VKALCLLPLAIPGVRVVMSGLSWFTWLNFPLSGFVATMMFIIMHVVMPILILALLYQVLRSLWPSETPRSSSQVWWFAISTFSIVVLSFLGTLGIAALTELSLCQIPPLTSFCSSRFVNTELTDIAANLDTYNFQFYNWIVWTIVTAYLYQLEHYLRVRQLSKNINGHQSEVLDEMNNSVIDSGFGQEFVDETA
jgi:hypothetical protein